LKKELSVKRFSQCVLIPTVLFAVSIPTADAAVGETRTDTVISGTTLRTMSVSGASRQKTCFDACGADSRCGGASVQLSSVATTATTCRLYSQAPSYKPLKGWVSWKRAPVVINAPKLVPTTSPIPGPIQAPVRAIDLAAYAVNFKVLRKITPGCGTFCEADVEIEGVVKNVGSQTFTSNPKQSIAYLYRDTPGASGALVAQLPITSLAPGATLSVKTTIRFRKSDEFPPSYKLQLGWDPDIALDGNPANDDSNRANDVKSRQSGEISALF